MKTLLHLAKILLISLICSMTSFAQQELENLVKLGIEDHDNGEYDKAIEHYLKALEIDKRSALVNYELSLSYFKKGNYKKAIKSANIALKSDNQFKVQALLSKASSLDELGNTNKSIKLLEKAIEVEKHFLLYYNLALNYYKRQEYTRAEETTIKAIELNPNHASSHLMLANIHSIRKNPVKVILAAHYFLFLEPNSSRSVAVYEMLQINFAGDVKRHESKENAINIKISPSKDPQFAAAEMMLSLISASNLSEEDNSKSKDELFIENTTTFFSTLGGLRKESKDDIWWSFYTELFSNLANSEHISTYCNYIRLGVNKNCEIWVENNQDKMRKLGYWLDQKNGM